MTAGVLVAGVGNIFLGDDAFGVEVVRRLAGQPLPRSVQVTDFGIGGIHLAYELMEGYDTAIIVDAAPRGERPGTVYVLEPESAPQHEDGAEPTFLPDGAITDAHAMEPGSVLRMVERLGVPTRVLVVGCEPAELGEHMGLSPAVDEAVDKAVRTVLTLLEEEAGSPSPSNVPATHPQREES